MGISKNKIKKAAQNHLPTLLLALLIAILVAFQACSDAKLFKPKSVSYSSSLKVPEFKSFVSPPQIDNSDVRVLIFLDQSHSMIKGKCAEDLDGTSPQPNPSDCTAIGSGADPAGDRFAVIQQWANDLKARGIGKMAIFPFSGGEQYERPRRMSAIYDSVLNKTINDNPSFYTFLTPDQALARLQDLKDEQFGDLQRANQSPPVPPLYMGTTVPAPQLTFAKDTIYQEMKSLQAQGKLYATTFRFIYMTDGVFKPTDAIMSAAMAMVGCPSSCLSPISPSSNGSLGSDSCANTAPGSTFSCRMFGTELRRAYGDPGANKVQGVIDIVKTISYFASLMGEGRISVDLVKIHPERIQPEDTDKNIAIASATKNIFDYIQQQIPKANYYELKNSTKPFDIIDIAPNALSYKLSDFYIVNLNAVVAADGSLLADSDGDGVPDDQERADNTDPTNPRTNNFCLDSINKNFGCKMVNCTETFDTDNDSLNQCEEMTLNTDSQLKDTDGDGILDYLEIVKGLDPNKDDRNLDDNSDGFSNKDAFLLGVSSYLNIPTFKSMNPNYLGLVSQYTTYFRGFGTSIPLTAGYTVKVDNIPLVPTLAVTKDQNLYYSKFPTPGSKIPNDSLPGPASHGANVNDILFVGRVAAVQDAKRYYWVMKRLQVPATGPNQSVSIQVDFSTFKQLNNVGN